MLVLSRQRDEAIVIGEGENQVVLRVVDIRGDKVRLGFDAPSEIKIHREEVYNAIHLSKEEGEKFVEALANPPPVAPALKRAAEEYHKMIR